MEFTKVFLTHLFELGCCKMKRSLKKLNLLGKLNRVEAKKQRIYKRSEINYTTINASTYSVIFTRI